jgi:hypothetical protein
MAKVINDFLFKSSLVNYYLTSLLQHLVFCSLPPWNLLFLGSCERVHPYFFLLLCQTISSSGTHSTTPLKSLIFIYTKKYYSTIKGRKLQARLQHGQNSKTKWSKTDHKRTSSVWFHLCKISRPGQLTETESRIEVSRGWGRKEWGVTTKGIRVLVYKRLLDRDNGDGCKTVWVCLMSLTEYLNTVKWCTFHFMHTSPRHHIKKMF